MIGTPLTATPIIPSDKIWGKLTRPTLPVVDVTNCEVAPHNSNNQLRGGSCKRMILAKVSGSTAARGGVRIVTGAREAALTGVSGILKMILRHVGVF